MQRRRPKPPIQTVTITAVSFLDTHLTFKFSVPLSELWHYVPGSAKWKRTTERKLSLIGCHDLHEAIRMLKKLDLIDPERYVIDFDTTYAKFYASIEFKKKRPGIVDEFPRHCSRPNPTDGNYATEVKL